MGLNVPAGGGDCWDSPDLVKIGGAAVEGGVFSNHFSKDDLSPKVQAFVSAYTTKYGAAPDALAALAYDCLLYTSDAADDLLCVDLGGRRIIKKKKNKQKKIP